MTATSYTPGYYEVRSDDDGYVDMLNLAADGEAVIVDESFLDGGVVRRVYSVGARRNPPIKIGPRFFQNALRAYSEWRLKWWRECVQNAVDAGARNIHLAAVESEDGTWHVSCQDDGCGMSEDTLINKFMVVGETGKEARSGMVGGFGKAKEFLIFPWPRWSITTRNIQLRGEGGWYADQVEQLDRDIGGTLVEVTMPGDQHTDISAANEYIQRCSIRRVKFFLNGELFTERLRKGSFVKSLSFGKIYRNKSKPYGESYVRADGLYMFAAGRFPRRYGTIVLEIEGDTTELLTDNRDGFRDDNKEWEIRDFVQEIVSEGERALRSRAGLVTTVWEGTGKISNERGMTDVINAIGPLPAIKAGSALHLGDDQIEGLVAFLGDLAYVGGGGLRLGVAPPEVTEVISTVPVEGATAVEAFARQLVWQPDFMVKNEVEGFRVPARFKPETMSPRLVTLAKVWAEACRWIFIQLGKHGRYGVGFLFSETAKAMHAHEEGQNWLLLSPYRDEATRGHILSKSSSEDLGLIYACAVHEVTHMADGYTMHDSSFAAALTFNMARCFSGWATMKKIAKAIKVEKAEKVEKKHVAKRAVTTPVTLGYSKGTQAFYVIPRERTVVEEAERVLGHVPYTTVFSTDDPDTVSTLFTLTHDMMSSDDYSDYWRLKRGSEGEVDAEWPRELVKRLVAATNKEWTGETEIKVSRAAYDCMMRVQILSLNDPVTVEMVSDAVRNWERTTFRYDVEVPADNRKILQFLQQQKNVLDADDFVGEVTGMISTQALYTILLDAAPSSVGRF